MKLEGLPVKKRSLGGGTAKSSVGGGHLNSDLYQIPGSPGPE